MNDKEAAAARARTQPGDDPATPATEQPRKTMNREARRRKIQPKVEKPANDEAKPMALGMRIGADFKAGLVLVQFNRKIDNMTFTPDGARQFSAAVEQWAKKIEESNGAHQAAGPRLILPPGVRDQ